MEKREYKPSTLLSIFNRKGGEGLLTKIIDDDNKLKFINQIASLEEGEQALLCFKQGESNWLLITNNRILQENAGLRLSIAHAQLAEVHLGIEEEFKDKITNKDDFTRIILKNNVGEKYTIKLEKGKPYQGIYQILHHIASNNKSNQ